MGRDRAHRTPQKHSALHHAGYEHPCALGRAACASNPASRTGHTLDNQHVHQGRPSLCSTLCKRSRPLLKVALVCMNRIDHCYAPELRYGKNSNHLMIGRFFCSCGLSSWKRLQERVTKKVLSNRKVGCPGLWIESKGLMGWTPWPGMLSHADSIRRDQHQSCTCVGSPLSVAGTRQSICESTLTVRSARRQWMENYLLPVTIFEYTQ